MCTVTISARLEEAQARLEEGHHQSRLHPATPEQDSVMELVTKNLAFLTGAFTWEVGAGSTPTHYKLPVFFYYCKKNCIKWIYLLTAIVYRGSRGGVKALADASVKNVFFFDIHLREFFF